MTSRSPKRCPVFLSTLPVRGATIITETTRSRLLISIHAPREGSDKFCKAKFTLHEFLSTLPVRGATVYRKDRSRPNYEISIHAPREGSDLSRVGLVVLAP